MKKTERSSTSSSSSEWSTKMSMPAAILEPASKRHALASADPNDRALRQRAARFLARLRRSVLPIWLLLAATWCVAAKPASVTAVLEPAAIGLGETAQLTVQIQGQDKDSFGFLRLVSPKREYYVGELVPVELRACFRAGAELRVNGLPRLNCDAFTMNKLSDQPARSQQMIGGVPYTVFSWSTAITAVKAGDYDLGIELPATVTVRQSRPAVRTRPRSAFGDPFFDEFFNESFFNGFFGTATQKEVSLGSQPSAVKILSLPTEGRPATFAGAVGKFEFAAEAAPKQITAGDPVTLKLTVTGSGNFDRVSAPAIERSEAWKTYKPSARFEPGDTAGCSGTKTFEEALVPTRSGQLAIPALTFSFFDPEQRQYRTQTASAMNIEVAHAPTASAAQAAPAASTTAATPMAAPSSVSGAANPFAPNSLFAMLRSWRLNPRLATGTVATMLVLFGAILFIRSRRRRARDPKRLRLTEAFEAVQAQLKNMERAVSQGGTAEFFAAARCAFQILLSLRWNLPPQTITLAEVKARMNGEAEELRAVLELADEVTYTGRALTADELKRWFQTVRAEVNRFPR